MRRAIMSLLILGLLTLPLPVAAAVPGLVTIYMGPQLLAGRVQTQTVAGELLVPARTLAEVLGASYKVGGESGTATIIGRETVQLRVGDSVVRVGDRLVPTGVPVAKVGGLIAAPVGVLAEVLGYRAEVVADQVRLVPQPDPGLAQQVLIAKEYRQSLRFQVSIDADGWTVIAGTLSQAGTMTEIALYEESGTRWTRELVALADIRNGQFTLRMRAEPGSTHKMELEVLGGETGFFWPTLATFELAVPSDVVVAVPAPVRGIVIEGVQGTGDLLEVKASVSADGELVLDGTVKAGSPWTNVRIWSVTAKPSFTVLVTIQEDRFHAVVPLPGPARHILRIGVPDAKDAKHYIPVARVQVEQTVKSARYPLLYEVNSPITLTAPATSGLAYAEKMTVAGQIDGMSQGYVIVSVVGPSAKNGDVAYHALAVKDGRFSGDVWLRFGEGRHALVLMTISDEGTLSSWVTATVENTGKRDLRHLAPSLRIESDAPEVLSLAKQIAGNAKEPLDKISAVHDWVAGNIAWDLKRSDNPLSDDARRTLRAKSGLPRDYAEVTVALLRAAGVEAVVVIGQVSINGQWYSHYWVEAKAGDRWVSLDPALDAGYFSGERFIQYLNWRRFDMKPDYLKGNYRKEVYQF